jgi:hypothetical protein
VLLVGGAATVPVVAAGASTPAAPQAATQAVAAPGISVSRTTGFDPAATETVTLTGVGFTPTANGTRPPLAGKPAGVYVAFGRFADTWKPSAGAPSSTRQIITQKWALPAASRAVLDPTTTQTDYVTIAEDGTFTAQLDIKTADGTGTYGVVTYPGSGATNADHEHLQPITFAEPIPDPAISVSKTTGFDPAATETVTVTGVGFTPTANGTRPPLAGKPAGVYVAFGRFADTWKPSAGAPSSSRQIISQRWALPAASRAVLDPTTTQTDYVTIADDGTFTAQLDIKTADGTGTYGIVTYPGSGATNATHEHLQPITFADPIPDPDPDPDPDPEPDPDPQPEPGDGRSATGPEGQELTVTPANDLDPAGATVRVVGEGYDSAQGVYVALCVDNGPTAVPSPCVGGVDMDGGGGSSAFISSDPKFAGLATPWGTGGTFDVELTISAADELVDCLDGVVTCKLVTRADHTASSDRSADVKVPVHWQGQPPIDEEPEPDPATIALSTSTVQAGDDLAVSGDGFLAGEQVQVWILSDPQLLDLTVADDDGAVSATVTIPADLEPGVHHIELRGMTSGVTVRSDDLTVLAASTTPTTDPTDLTATPTPSAPTPAVGSGTLARTGTDLGLVALSTLLLLGGASALAGSRRLARQGDHR